MKKIKDLIENNELCIETYEEFKNLDKKEQIQLLLCDELAISYDTVNFANKITDMFNAYLLSITNRKDIKELTSESNTETKQILKRVELCFKLMFKDININKNVVDNIENIYKLYYKNQFELQQTLKKL